MSWEQREGFLGRRESDESGSIQMIQKGGVQYESQTELSTKQKLLTEGQNKSMDLSGLRHSTNVQ